MAFYKPPTNIATRNRNNKSVFLAGSIEMGAAENWQDTVGEFFHQNNWDVLNPRRDDWDSSWKQTFEDAQFYQQVNWELEALEVADVILMYLDPNTKSPISLLELGLHATSKKLYVVCPDGFYRRGNVEMVCSTYDIPLFNTLEEFKKYLTN
jgi:hypothetical protein